MSKASRSKGVRGELEVVHLLEEFGIPAARQAQYRGAVLDGPDIVTDTSDAPHELSLHVEVKRTEAWKPSQTYAQLNNDIQPGRIGLVFWRRNRGNWIAAMRPGDMGDIIPSDRLQATAQFGQKFSTSLMLEALEAAPLHLHSPALALRDYIRESEGDAETMPFGLWETLGHIWAVREGAGRLDDSWEGLRLWDAPWMFVYADARTALEWLSWTD